MDKYEDNIDVELNKKLAKREKELGIENTKDEVTTRHKAIVQREKIFEVLDNAIERKYLKRKKR
ncbi:MAG: hypothetical protein WB588_00735 [Dehalococcoidia bacterium]